MLQDLKIQNYALIQHLQLQPSARLNIITGETGAGKSIMLGALGLLLGNRADTRMLFDQQQKCVIEGAFDISAYQLESFFQAAELDFEQVCIMRREISPNSKSRAFINDTPVSLETMRSLGSYLMDVHSQHDTQQLGDPAFQLGLLDSFAQNAALKGQYGSSFQRYRQLSNQFKALNQRLLEANKELDYHTFLLQELVAAALQADEQEQTEEQLKRLEHAEEIKLKLTQAYQGISEAEPSILSQLKDVAYLINGVAGYAEAFQKLKARLDSCAIELDDLAEEIGAAANQTEHDPELIEKLQDRLDLMYQLQRKHAVRSNAELLAIQEDLERKVGSVLNLDKEIESTRKALAAGEAEMLKLGAALTKSRTKVFAQFESELHRLLQELGMPNAKVQVSHKAVEPVATGLDEVGILFSANKGSAPQPLAKVASGGEFSRLMLSIKYVLADKTALPTIIFDEIDTGISGEVAIKVGKMMQQMARNHQLIAISHLPQIAAKGDAHYFVYKEDLADRTISRIRKLNETDRVAEIAHMIAGANPTINALESARELLESR